MRCRRARALVDTGFDFEDNSRMSTLVQIESAVAGLPPQEQQSLLTWLQGRLLSASKARDLDVAEREAWLQRLEQLRRSVAIGRDVSSSESIVDDLRSERGG
jgi:hypothetical protein